MKRVLITGVSGYLGSKLARHLGRRREVEEIIGLDVKEPPSSIPKLVYYRRDVRQPVHDLVRDHRADTVVHTAYVLPPIHDIALMEDINVNGTMSVLSSCREAGVRHVLYLSSTTAYGFHPDNRVPLTEGSPLRGNDDFTYSRTKRQIEGIMAGFAKANPRIRVTVVRACFVVGPGFDNPLSAHLKKKLVLLPSRTSPFQFVHEDDLVEIMYILLKRRKGGVYNVAADGVIGFDDMVRMLGNIMVPLPPAVMGVLNAVAWKLRLSFLTEFPSPALNMVRYPWIASNRKVKEELGYSFRYTSQTAFGDFARVARAAGKRV